MPKEKAVSIIYTETFKHSATDVRDYLAHYHEDPKEIIDKQLDEFENKVRIFPEGCQISRDLSALGCYRYRECITKDGYRILYSFDPNANDLTTHVILGQKQSVQQLLFDRIIFM